jgi:hypothetical protein
MGEVVFGVCSPRPWQAVRSGMNGILAPGLSQAHVSATGRYRWQVSTVLYSSLRHGGTAAWHRTGCGARDGVISGDDVVNVDGSQHVGCSSSSNDGDGDVGS